MTADPDTLPPIGTQERATILKREWYRRNALRQKGPNDRVPADAARAVLKTLHEDYGFTYLRLAEIFGMDRSALQKTAIGRNKMIAKSRHDAITNTDVRKLVLGEHPSNGRVLAKPYREKLRQYGAAGWPPRVLSEMCEGVELYRHNIWRDRATYIRPADAEALDALFEKIGDRLGPDELTARRYRKMGYFPPAAYDDDGTLVPGAAL